MQEQLLAKQERDAREAAEQSQKGDLRAAIRPRVEAWQAGKKVTPASCSPGSRPPEHLPEPCQAPPCIFCHLFASLAPWVAVQLMAGML